MIPREGFGYSCSNSYSLLTCQVPIPSVMHSLSFAPFKLVIRLLNMCNNGKKLLCGRSCWTIFVGAQHPLKSFNYRSLGRAGKFVSGFFLNVC